MTFFRRSRQLLSGTLLALVLFCQAALAVAACVSPERCPTMAFASASCEHGRHADSVNGNLCLAHATAGDQSFDGMATMPPVAPMVLHAGVVIPAALYVGREVPCVARPDLVGAPPPIPILFCSFLI